MTFQLVRCRVEDFERWQQVFDLYHDLREDYGLVGVCVFQDSANPNDLTVLLHWCDPDGMTAYEHADDTEHFYLHAGAIGSIDEQVLRLHSSWCLEDSDTWSI